MLKDHARLMFIGFGSHSKSVYLPAIQKLSQHEVSCSFEVTEEDLNILFPNPALPEGLIDQNKRDDSRVSLTCRWSGLSSKDRTITLKYDIINSMIVLFAANHVITTTVSP